MHNAKYLAVGLTAIVLMSGIAVVPVVEASGGGWSMVAHFPTDDSSDAPAMSLPEDVPPDEEIEGIESQAINLGTRITDSVDEGETKRYAFAVEAEQMIRIVHNDIREPATLTLYNPSGEAIAQDTTRSKYRHPFGAMAGQSGTYTLEVRSQNATTYQFNVDTRDPDYVASHATVSNDDRETALLVDSDTGNVSATLAEGETDWYAVDLDEGDRLDVTVSHELTGPGNDTYPFDLGNGIQVDVFDPAGQDVGQIDLQDSTTGSDWSEYADASQRTTAETAGTYYIHVSNSSYMGGFADYELSVEITDENSGTPA